MTEENWKEKSFFTRKEIESHSTMITNDRIGDIKRIVYRAGLAVQTSQPDPIATNAFFSSLFQWWLESPGIFEVDINVEIGKKIRDIIKRGNILSTRLRLYGNLGIIETEELLQSSLELQYLMNYGYQNLHYYFKVSSPEPKGFDMALEIFNLEELKQLKKLERKDVEGNIYKEH